ncbi:DNA alkylation repair protein [Anaerosporobacter faecicola]|uniref:DNA alkylation repair protein n=1 Tax=Anaerosporobacter faecicola TaxID=2718714 RepID=UPI00143C2EB1|nr:DNA alkylation repair protein [Anaerosporobacter faecicola]
MKPDVISNQEIKEQLAELAEEKFRKFTSRLLPGGEPILGVRLPKLRSIAKQIAKGDYQTYLTVALDDSYEEIMLQGMVIGYVKAPIDEILQMIKNFLSKIDNWSVCDSFCSGLKIAREEREIFWNFIQPYVYSGQEFQVRFAVVMLLDYFVEEAYVTKACQIFDQIKHEGYYVKMAVAWAISIYYIAYPARMVQYLQNCKLDSFTYHKALQKICESRAVSAEEKEKIRTMRDHVGFFSENPDKEKEQP